MHAQCCLPKSTELLKTLMKSGNVVLIRSVFFQSPLGSGMTQGEPNADRKNLSHHHHGPWRGHVYRATHQEVLGTTWERGGVGSSWLLRPDHPLVEIENRRFLGCLQPAPAPKFVCFLLVSSIDPKCIVLWAVSKRKGTGMYLARKHLLPPSAYVSSFTWFISSESHSNVSICRILPLFY